MGRSKGTDGLKDQNCQSGSDRIDRNTFPLRNDPCFSRGTNFAEQPANHCRTGDGEYCPQNKSHRRWNIQKASNTVLSGVLDWRYDVLGNLQAMNHKVPVAKATSYRYAAAPQRIADVPDWVDGGVVVLNHFGWEHNCCCRRDCTCDWLRSSRVSIASGFSPRDLIGFVAWKGRSL